MPPDAPIPLLVPEYLQSLLAPNTPLIPLHPGAPKHPQTASYTTKEPPMSPDVPYTASGP